MEFFVKTRVWYGHGQNMFQAGPNFIDFRAKLASTAKMDLKCQKEEKNKIFENFLIIEYPIIKRSYDMKRNACTQI